MIQLYEQAWQQMNTSLLIWAGMLANSGLLAKVDRFSTASRSGVVATRHLFLFSSEKSPSKAWNKTITYEYFTKYWKRAEFYAHPQLPMRRKEFCNKFTLNVLISWGDDLDGFDKVGCSVGNLFGRLDELSPSHGVGGLGGRQAAGVTESWGVLGDNCCCRQDLTYKDTSTNRKQSCIKMRCVDGIFCDIQVDFKVFKLNFKLLIKVTKIYMHNLNAVPIFQVMVPAWILLPVMDCSLGPLSSDTPSV